MAPASEPSYSGTAAASARRSSSTLFTLSGGVRVPLRGVLPGVVRRGAAALLVVGVDLVLDACPSAPSLLRRLFCRTGLGSLHLLVTGARRCAGALCSSQSDFIFHVIVLYIL